MPTIECIFLERTDLFEESLRRYTWSAAARCSTHTYGHDACVVITSAVPRPSTPQDHGGYSDAQWSHGDPRWPVRCACGYEFQPTDEWQHNVLRMYRCTKDGQLYILRNAPVGAMWYADWLHDPLGPDGHHLVVKTPGGDWHIDGRAGNCTLPHDKEHRCWPRQGVPPLVTVAKNLGPTCSAGAGSIMCGKYHGFLREGKLIDA